MRLRTKTRPSTRIEVRSLARMREFFTSLGWREEEVAPAGEAWFESPGGRFVLVESTSPALVPRIELALPVPDALIVEQIAELVEPAGGITTEPAQETTYGGWGFTFNDPEGNNWEIGAPTTVTHVDLRLGGQLGTGFDGPLVALSVPPRAARQAG